LDDSQGIQRDSLDGDNIIGTNFEIAQMLSIDLLEDRKAPAILPQKSDQTALTKDASDCTGLLIPDHCTVYAPSKSFDGLDQVGILIEKSQGFLLAQVLDLSKWYRFPFSCSSGQLEEILGMLIVGFG
jgi:hypothetical protein